MLAQPFLPTDKINSAKVYVNSMMASFREQSKCVFESALFQPVKLGKYGCRCCFSLASLLVAILVAFSLAFVEYGTFYYIQVPNNELV